MLGLKLALKVPNEVVLTIECNKREKHLQKHETDPQKTPTHVCISCVWLSFKVPAAVSLHQLLQQLCLWPSGDSVHWISKTLASSQAFDRFSPPLNHSTHPVASAVSLSSFPKHFSSINVWHSPAPHTPLISWTIHLIPAEVTAPAWKSVSTSEEPVTVRLNFFSLNVQILCFLYVQ